MEHFCSFIRGDTEPLIHFLQFLQEGGAALILTGAGTEFNSKQPSIIHALIVGFIERGASLITTNVTPAFLLTMSPGCTFIALHSLLVDLKKRNGQYYRMRTCIVDERDGRIPSEFKTRGSACPIPTSLMDTVNDPNFKDACTTVNQGKFKLFIVLGHSFNIGTNGVCLKFLEDAKSVELVLVINPDPCETCESLHQKLIGFGMQEFIKIALISCTAECFTNIVLDLLSEERKEYVQSLIADEVIQRRRRWLEYPDRGLIPRDHLASGISLVELYDMTRGEAY